MIQHDVKVRDPREAWPSTCQTGWISPEARIEYRIDSSTYPAIEVCLSKSKKKPCSLFDNAVVMITSKIMHLESLSGNIFKNLVPKRKSLSLQLSNHSNQPTCFLKFEHWTNRINATVCLENTRVTCQSCSIHSIDVRILSLLVLRRVQRLLSSWVVSR
jgi:hypothetical protein